MSTIKGYHSLGETTEGYGRPHSASPRKKSRLSSITEKDGEGSRQEPDVLRDGTDKPSSVLMQPFRLHRRLKFVSEGVRPSKRNKRPTSGHQRPRKVPNLPSPNAFPYSDLPELFDVTPGLLDAIPLADGELSCWKPEHAAFINSAAGLDDANWIGKRPLGSGSFATAGLWELRDENNVVTEQIVIKESKTIPVGVWTGKVPEEVKMMRRMNKTDCQTVPELLAYKRYMHVRKHRIYMEYCPYSDLATLNLNYKRFRFVNPNLQAFLYSSDEQRTYLPEPFLWETFNNLVKVAAAMESGPDDINWGYVIVHRDLKPANIFLGLEDENSGFPLYPVAKTGDWGLARKVKHDDHRNPIGLRGTGTESYYAPEQRVPHSGDEVINQAQIAKHLNGTAPLPKLSARTNIWGIGAIMFELLTHEAVAYYLNDDEWTVNEVFTDIPNVRNPKYSGALTELIKLCLMPEPWDRPSIEELNLKIGTNCQSITSKYAANPSLHQQERLYYKGSEISQMPPGNWNYWYPVMKDVPNPSASPDSKVPKNIFTNSIIYPPFPTSELDGPEEKGGGEVQEDDDGNDGGNKDVGKFKGLRDDGVGKIIVISDDPSSGPIGNNADNPVVISDSDEEDGVDERGERNRVHEGDGVNDGEEGKWVNENDESNDSNRNTGSEDNESSERDSDNSDDSDVRRRMAVKKLPGT